MLIHAGMREERFSVLSVDEVDQQCIDGHSAELGMRVARRGLRNHIDKIQHVLDGHAVQYSGSLPAYLIQRCNLRRYLVQSSLEIHANDGVLPRVLPEPLNRVQFEDLLIAC